MAKVVVVLDPGHGGHDPGVTRAGVKESDLAMRYVWKIRWFLREVYGIEVKVTRDSFAAYPSLRSRPAIANREREKGHRVLFVSVHWNGHTSDANGFEVLTRFYRRTEYDLGFAKKMSEAIEFTYKKLGLVKPNRGIKRMILAVLRTRNLRRDIPGVLIEPAFLSNADDRRDIQDPVVVEEMCKQLADAIADEAGVPAKAIPPKEKLYRITVGDFRGPKERDSAVAVLTHQGWHHTVEIVKEK